ncbi:armadillo-type protein, partial [Phycomyces blakesleeanus]
VDFEDNVSELTPEMDIFSVGCVIAELFLEGTSIFSLSQLFKYRSGEYKPDSNLNKIEDKHIRDMIRHMIQIDPTKRYSAKQYLQKWYMRGKAFPKYFDTFLHEYINSVTENNGSISIQQHSGIDTLSSLTQALPGTIASSKRKTDADEKIEHIHNDFDKITYNVSFKSEPDENLSDPYTKRLSGSSDSSNSSDEEPRFIILPPTLNIPNYEPSNTSAIKPNNSNKTEEHGYLILLSFVCSLIRNTSYPSSKLKALDILLALGENLPDDVKLDRLVPYLMVLLSDETALVRANAIKTLTQVLCMVESISPINARIFPEYILPSVREFATDPDVLVRTTYASCIALLAETALRFLEMTQLLKNDSAFPLTDMDTEDLDFESAYDSSLNDLHSVIQEQVTVLLIDNESSVKRALLTNITCLCGFFGRQKTNDVLLSHMITYLNDKDWMLRSAFFESIKGVGTFVGSRSLEEYILPLMIQALTDAEEFVVESVLNSLTSLSDLDLFEKMKSWELVGIIAPLICHPSVWIQYGAIGFISSTAKHLPQTDLWCIIYPLLKPFLRSDISEVNETCLLQNIKTPLPRQVYEQAIIWANKASIRSLFWKPQQDKRNQSGSSSKDEMFIERLRKVGMSVEDERRLGYMRDYIYKVSQSKLSRPKASDDLNGEIFLKNLGVTPMTVFLPDLSQEAHVWNVKSYKTILKATLPSKLSIPQHIKEDDCKLNRVASQPHVQALLYNSQGNDSDNDNKQSFSPIPSPTEYNFGMDIHNTNANRKKGFYIQQKIWLSICMYFLVGYGHLQGLLHSVAMDAFSPHIPEFIGDPAVMKRMRRLPQGTSPFRTISNWKPEGTLVAHFTEHTAAINQLAISWDNLLFASCSDDGSVKIWDCSRLERNVTNRSRATYNQQGKLE